VGEPFERLAAEYMLSDEVVFSSLNHGGASACREHQANRSARFRTGCGARTA
jgi:hypothetical protein